MNKKILIFAAIALGASPVAVLAQDASPSESVHVTAPLLITKKPLPTTKGGIPVSLLSIEKSVSYADLDLTKEAGAAQFRARIRDTAAELCKALDSKYPRAMYIPVNDQDCVKATTDSAMPVVNEIIAAR